MSTIHIITNSWAVNLDKIIGLNLRENRKHLSGEVHLNCCDLSQFLYFYDSKLVGKYGRHLIKSSNFD